MGDLKFSFVSKNENYSDDSIGGYCPLAISEIRDKTNSIGAPN